jgi:hypothetical protein
MGEKNFNLILDEELLERIKEEAKRDSRSMRREIPILIVEALRVRDERRMKEEKTSTHITEKET